MINLRKFKPYFWLFFIFFIFISEVAGQSFIKVQRLSERVLVLTEESPMNNNVVAIATDKGLVVIDVTGSPYTASKMREKIVEEFGRSDFAYVIDTHHHWDHAWGNQVFADADIIAHERCPEQLLGDVQAVPRVVSSSREALADRESELSDLDPESDEAKEVKEDIEFRKRIIKGLSEGFKPTPPNIGFSDRMTLDLGNVTLKMFYFGRAHSGCDIFIMVPEEGILITGDIFLDQRWLPLFSGMNTLDIPRWIEVLGEILDGDDKLKKVIPGHKDLWSPEKLDLWRDYIVELWAFVNKTKERGYDLEHVLAQYSLKQEYYYLKDLGHDETAIQRFHERNIRSFWSQLFESAATIIGEVIEEKGIDEAVKKFREIRSEDNSDYLFDETQFNALGYRLMGQRKLKEAIEVFKMNVEMYPGSWNVYDSIGEAYMTNGQNELAIKNYDKSLELNPENANAVEMLKRLK